MRSGHIIFSFSVFIIFFSRLEYVGRARYERLDGGTVGRLDVLEARFVGRVC